ncbi:MAG TPA: twin-arginine translocase subunit TatC [Armatimonadota bacterium]|nr:twin-arginine translocase subunit TatC [Armatimonadota bacterium]
MANGELKAVQRRPANRTRREWLLDAIAFASMFASVIGLMSVTYVMSVNTAYTFLADPAGRERFSSMYRSFLPALAAYMGIAVVLAVVLWITMLLDCVRAISLGKGRRYVIWMVILVLLHVSAAWLYYLIERRPRRLARADFAS